VAIFFPRVTYSSGEDKQFARSVSAPVVYIKEGTTSLTISSLGGHDASLADGASHKKGIFYATSIADIRLTGLIFYLDRARATVPKFMTVARARSRSIEG
jgi:hypothetical protein